MSGRAAHGRILCATVTTAEVGRQAELYEQALGYRVVTEGVVDGALAHSWGAEAQEGRPFALLGPASSAEVFVRFVEAPEPPTEVRPLTSYGWAAIEISVQDADRLYESLVGGPFEILGPPRELDFSDRIYPMQVAGPSGEVLFLNEVRGSLPDFDLPVAESFVDRIFIVVLAAPELEAALDFYQSALGFERGNRYEIAYAVINQAFGMDPDRRHRLAMTCVGRRVNLEVDQYPAETVERPGREGFLPPGIAAVTLEVTDLDDLAAPLQAPPVVRPEAPYAGRRTACCYGAAGELVELVEGGR